MGTVYGSYAKSRKWTLSLNGSEDKGYGSCLEDTLNLCLWSSSSVPRLE